MPATHAAGPSLTGRPPTMILPLCRCRDSDRRQAGRQCPAPAVLRVARRASPWRRLVCPCAAARAVGCILIGTCLGCAAESGSARSSVPVNDPADQSHAAPIGTVEHDPWFAEGSDRASDAIESGEAPRGLAAQSPGETPTAVRSNPDGDRLLGILLDKSAPIESRTDAALRLLRGDVSRDPAALDAGTVPVGRLVALLSEPLAHPAPPADAPATPPPPAPPVPAQLVLMRAIADMPTAPGPLAKPLATIAAARDHASDSPMDLRLAAVRALSSVRTRESARALFDLTASTEPIRTAALSALARLSGRADLGEDRARWERWLGGVEWTTEAEWRRVLAEGLAARADALSARSESALAKLVEVLSRRYAATEAAAERSSQLASMLRDDLDAVKRLGFSLATTELANARPLEPVVAEAAIGCLADDESDIRAAAADLLRLIAQPEQAEAIARAVMVETDPAAAARLLACVARFPREEVIQPAVRWLAHGALTEGPAIDALLALQRAELLSNVEATERIVEMLLRIDPTTSALSPRQIENRESLLEALRP